MPTLLVSPVARGAHCLSDLSAAVSQWKWSLRHMGRWPETRIFSLAVDRKRDAIIHPSIDFRKPNLTRDAFGLGMSKGPIPMHVAITDGTWA